MIKVFILILLQFGSLKTKGKMQNSGNNTRIISDSQMDFERAVSGLEFPTEIESKLTLISVEYFSFDNRIHRGQLLVNKLVANSVKEIFNKLLNLHFPIAKVIPISKFNWNDEKSMQENNTSAFNYRKIKGTSRLSKHSYGLAIDINPLLNPYVKENSVEPEGATYNPNIPGTITNKSEIVKIFKSFGWHWGGDWHTVKDYQHFEFSIKEK